MLARGRITPDEAARVRAAADERERQAALTAIRLRHATARADTAVGEGRISRRDADEALGLLALGGDTTVVRRLLAGPDGPGGRSGHEQRADGRQP